MRYDAYLAGSQLETRNLNPKLYYILFFSVTSGSSVANEIKKPQPSWGESWGFINSIRYPPFPAKGLRDQSELSRFPGLRLPNSHAFPDNVQWLKNR
jgi:hypothetical protein